MTYGVEDFVAGTEAISEDSRESFGGLSREQLNWQAVPDSWSVAQCLDHLIKTNEGFNEIFSALADGTHQPTFMEKWSPLSGILGNFLMKSIKDDSKKYKAPSEAIIPQSDLDEDIVEQFNKHQKQVAEKVKAFGHLNWGDIVITSPFMKMLTYRLDTALEFTLEHEKRHIRQAKRVMETQGFPE